MNSYGLSPYDYDARIAYGFKIFTDLDGDIVDPKKSGERSFVSRNLPVSYFGKAGKTDGPAWCRHASNVSRVPLCPDSRTEPLNNG